ncbi:conserved exported hypothetical protein [Nitrospira lenta]|uniref:Uncharacterized protein n=1 Tax=Nitrospira lenta TaxID=1436998 RepID=A0A330L8X0_9BACT|nr:conserved exported hypothetical protein [Nitrospira lenta]
MRRNCRDAPALVLLTLLLALTPAAISSCIETPSSRLVTAKDTLLGKSESEVVACAGAPRTASSQDRVKVLTYQKSSGPLEGSFPGIKGSRPEGARHGCTATLTLQDDRVIQVQYRTTPDSSDLHEHCEEIFRCCVPQ